jgi:hypothetical protein
MSSGARPRRERLERSGALREAAMRHVVDALVERQRRGELHAMDVRAAAITAEVSERTVWRWLAAGRPPAPRPASPTRRVLTAELRDAYSRLGGNAAAVWREARERGAEPPGLRTLQAAFARELSPAERASACRGEAGRREHACICATRRRIAMLSGRPIASSCHCLSSRRAVGGIGGVAGSSPGLAIEDARERAISRC